MNNLEKLQASDTRRQIGQDLVTRVELFKQHRFGKELCHLTGAMNFIGDLDGVKYCGTKGAHRDILRPAGLGQIRKVAGVGGF